MKQKKEQAISNTKIAIVFFAFLAFIIATSLIFKTVLVIKAGQFDESKRFTLSVSNNKRTEVVSFSPSAKSIAVFKLPKSIQQDAAGRLLEVPIDGFITLNSLDLDQKVSLLFLSSILKYNSLKTNLTAIDLLKLFAFARTVSDSSVNIKSISQDLNSAEVDKIVGRLAHDELIEKDNETIQIINGTDIGGFGNRLARFITNMGGNVIIVATSDRTQKKSTISYIDKKTYTVEKLSKILGYDVIRISDNAISDITITIGEDKASFSPF